MGNRNTNSSLRNAIILLNISADHISVHDEKFWTQIWQEDFKVAAEVIKSISTQEIRMLRDGSPRNFATLSYKMVERLHLATGTLCNTSSQQTAVLNATRILVRLLPCVFEDNAWSMFFSQNYLTRDVGKYRSRKEEPKLKIPEKNCEDRDYESYLPTGSRVPTDDAAESAGRGDSCKDRPQLLIDDLLSQQETSDKIDEKTNGDKSKDCIAGDSLMQSLILSICDLLFCPEFTVSPHYESYLLSKVDAPPEDLKSLATCDYVWEPGVGFDSNVNSTTYYDKSRSELIKLLLACLSSTLYDHPSCSIGKRNEWIDLFTSTENRHALPLFTSLLNTIFSYKPPKLLPFNKVLFEDNREELVELSIQLLIATLDHKFDDKSSSDGSGEGFSKNGDSAIGENPVINNLFIEYMSRIHRPEDYAFLIDGFARLLNVRLAGSYLLSSTKQINFDQELLVLFWKFCNFNKKFISVLLDTNQVLDIIVPTLYHLSENFQDPSKTGLIHIGVFNLLILSGDRNFGVKLNRAYESNIIPNLPHFTGSHADLMIIVFHKLILYGLNLNQLYDFLLTIVVNISPYLKSLTMLACKCLIQVFEIFSSPFVILTEPNYHQLVIFLLEIFNNLIQYQFDGNATLVYVIISHKDGFINLANLPASQQGIEKILKKLKRKMDRYLTIDHGKQQDADGSIVSETESNEKVRNQNNQLSNIQRILGAKVSSGCCQPASRPNNQQEVSLVATPDIGNVTQTIHPFDDSSDCVFNFKTKTVSQSNPDEPTINFEDNIKEVVDQINKKGDTYIIDHKERGESSRTDFSMEEFGLETLHQDRSPSCTTRTWRPTPDWVKQYKLSLPLHSITRMIEVLAPQLDQFKQTNSGNFDEQAAIKYLQSSTLVGLLPVPHPILIRKYRTNQQTALWFRACTWGMIFVRNTIWTDTDVKLIKVV